MLSLVCSFFPRFRKYSCNDLRFSFLIVGGVLLALGLAFIPNNSYAAEIQSVDRSYTVLTSRMGCNVVNSFSGIMAIGPRGSITGADNNPSGCNYYLNNGNLTWRSNSDYYSANLYYNPSGSYDHTYSNNSMTSFSEDYLKYNFRSSLMWISNSVQSDSSFDYSIPAQNYSDKFGAYSIVVAVKWFDSLVHSNLPPSLSSSHYTGLTDQQYSNFQKDVYDHTIYRCGDPRDFVNDFTYADLQINLSGSLDDYCYIISYLPQYNFNYSLADFSYSLVSDLVQNSIDRNLGGFQQFEIGLGNSVGSATFPRLDYFALSNPYTANNNQLENFVQSAYSFRYTCLTAECFNQGLEKSNNTLNYHNTAINSYQFSGNPAGSWFDVFSGLSVINPFSVIFNSFTNSQCVDIPIIAGMLNVNNTQYCSWWGSGVRQVLTPVFTISAMVLLFGFVIHWLRDGDGYRPLLNQDQIERYK